MSFFILVFLFIHCHTLHNKCYDDLYNTNKEILRENKGRIFLNLESGDRSCLQQEPPL